MSPTDPFSRDLNPSDMEERATEARQILNNKWFRKAMEEVEYQQLVALRSIPLGTSQATTAHAIIQSVGAVTQVLEHYANAPAIAKALGGKTKR